MIRFAICVTIFWSFWFYFEVPYLMELKDILGMLIWPMVAIYHVFWLGLWAAD